MTHSQEGDAVVNVRGKIKDFLTSHGMIKGTSGSGSRTAEPDPPRLRISERDYSSSESPPTPVLSLPEEIPHPTLTLSSERDEPYPSPLSPSYPGASRLIIMLPPVVIFCSRSF
jgi:hypothetical protein